MSKTTKLIIAGLIAALLLGAGSIAFYANNPSENTTQNQSTTQQTEQTEQKEQTQQPEQSQAKLTSSEDGKTVSYEGQDGKTALAVLQSLAEVETKESAYGEFVTSINGVEADGTKQFWAFYVNDKLANEGAGTYQSKNSDNIKWQVEDVIEQ